MYREGRLGPSASLGTVKENGAGLLEKIEAQNWSPEKIRQKLGS